jgi:hypothetical protein
VWSFCFGLLISPPLALSAKNEEKRRYDTDRVVVEALPLPITPFPFQSKTKHRNTLGNTLVLALEQEE